MNGVPLPYLNLSVDYLKQAGRNKAQEKEIHVIVLALSHTTPYFTGLRRCPWFNSFKANILSLTEVNMSELRVCGLGNTWQTERSG